MIKTSSTSSYINTNENFQSTQSQLNNIQNTNKTIEANANPEMNYQQVDYLQNNIQAYLNNGMQANYNNMYAPVQQQQIPKEVVKMELEDKELWTRFYNLNNEMILTKAGRYVSF